MELKRTVKITGDGSKTLFINDLNESYHSTYGALQEAQHVFIKNGLKRVNFSEINILELGFGTGLNALVTFNEFLENDSVKKINYFTLEKYPVCRRELQDLNYASEFEATSREFYESIHAAPWDEKIEIFPNFGFRKFHSAFSALGSLKLPEIHLVYFDCFGANVQPELWEKPMFEMVADKMTEEALLTTYSSKGSVRRILKELGFTVAKLEGPPGKREMINAVKKG